ncbi:MAG: glycosyltransferase, partial [Pseudomonadota bacterium]
FVANSSFIARRIKRVYGREAVVVNPPVDLSLFGRGAPQARSDFYLVVSQLVGYKRVDLAIEAVRSTGRKLVVAGQGEALGALQASAPDNVTFLGAVSTEKLVELYATARALIFPGEEDFGIVPIEAIASGCPVVAYGRGGVLDSLQDGVTGVFFAEQTVGALLAALERFEAGSFPAGALQERAHDFSEERFRARFTAAVSAAMERQRSPVTAPLAQVAPPPGLVGAG